MYCGCHGSNKLKWAIAILAFIFGLALIAGAIGKAASDIKDYDDCLKTCVRNGEITASQYDQYKDGPDWNDSNFGDTGVLCVDNCQNKYFDNNAAAVSGLFWAGIALLVIASIPCYIMCCCTSRPASTNGHVIAVPYSGAPVATPYQASNAQYQAPQPTSYAYPAGNAQDAYAPSAAPVGYPTNYAAKV